ncbi:MAG: hypothetical protein E2O65_06445 [Gammaproteobacteria bacterium]|nr:MAG: hypothetical protein E2O65_06445 [Gammaproteobacteria bacterium]
MSELLVTSPIRSSRQYIGGRDEGRRYTQGSRETPRSRRTTVAARPIASCGCARHGGERDERHALGRKGGSWRSVSVKDAAATWALGGSRRGAVPHPDTQAQSRSDCAGIAEITYWQFYFRFFPGAICSPQIVEFLKVLRRQIPGKLLVIWDGLRAHRSRMVRDYAEEKRGDIQLEFLPAYAPELNPTEYIGGYLKTHEIGNLCARHVGEVRDLASRRLRSMQRRPALVRAFWKQAELAF